MGNRADSVVFQSGVLWEVEMVADALEQAGIPYYRRLDELGLGELAMPVMPACGPGALYVYYTAPAVATRAREVIAGLPLAGPESRDEGVWTFRPTSRVRTGFRIGAGIALAILGLSFIYSVSDLLYRAFH